MLTKRNKAKYIKKRVEYIKQLYRIQQKHRAGPQKIMIR